MLDDELKAAIKKELPKNIPIFLFLHYTTWPARIKEIKRWGMFFW